jgi:hypothetical protein
MNHRHRREPQAWQATARRGHYRVVSGGGRRRLFGWLRRPALAHGSRTQGVISTTISSSGTASPTLVALV